MNQIKVYFDLCNPPPSGGYNVQYRVAGSSDSYTNAGYFFTSPAIFYDTINPAGTCYEGFMRTNCGGVLGTPIFFESCTSGGGGSTALSISWDFIRGVASVGHAIIYVNDVIVVNTTASGSGNIIVNIGDTIKVIVTNTEFRQCVIDINGPYTNAILAPTTAEDQFITVAGIYTIHCETL